MKHWNRRSDAILPTGGQDEVTRELTGTDAHMDEAAIGDAGNGADPFGADLAGGPPTPIEDPPDLPHDILPDEVETWPGQPADQERELTAQPSEPDPHDRSRLV